ncbi:MAG: CueP family metal-binding protein [Microbacterium sp.]
MSEFPLPSPTSPLYPTSPLSPASPRGKKLIAALAAIVVAGVTLAGCAAAPDTGATGADQLAETSDILAAYDLDRLDVVEVIELLDTMPVSDRPSGLLASVQPGALVLKDESGRESRMPLPEDEVYVSVAPFRDQTHECHFHSLTTCLGELSDAEVDVTLTTDDGDVLIDGDRRTYDNGFIGLWVPRGIEATLTIEHEGQAGTALISTMTADDPTCVTTLQLL